MDNGSKKTYFLQQDSEGRIALKNKEGIQEPLLSLLHIYPDARIYALDGVMGAGKTTLLKQLCHDMGTEDVVNSPTFSIVNVYDTDNQEIYHFDCYRLNSLNEAQSIGAEEYLYSGNYCFIEWPDVMMSLLPEDTVWIHISILPSGDRQLIISKER